MEPSSGWRASATLSERIKSKVIIQWCLSHSESLQDCPCEPKTTNALKKIIIFLSEYILIAGDLKRFRQAFGICIVRQFVWQVEKTGCVSIRLIGICSRHCPRYWL